MNKIDSLFLRKYDVSIKISLKNKKIMLFAPTFRGNGQMSAFYPTDAFDIEKAYEGLGGEYAILIKLHPFCEERFEIPEKYKNLIVRVWGFSAYFTALDEELQNEMINRNRAH